MQFLGTPDRTNHPHSIANPEKQSTKQRKETNANKTGADGCALAELAVAVHTTPPRPPPCICYANVRNYYGPYTHCSLAI